MKKIVLCFLLMFTFITVKADNLKIYLFYGDGCPHCEKEKQFLKEIKQKYGDQIELYYYETWYNEENNKLMELTKEQYNVTKKGVPFTTIGKESFLGFGESTKKQITEAIDENLGITSSEVENIIENQNIDKEKLKVEDGIYHIPLLGKKDVRNANLSLVSMLLGIKDSLNIGLLLTILLVISLRKNEIKLGSVFLLISFATIFVLTGSNIVLNQNAIRIVTSFIILAYILFIISKKYTNNMNIMIISTSIFAIFMNLFKYTCLINSSFIDILKINATNNYLYTIIYSVSFIIIDIVIFIIYLLIKKYLLKRRNYDNTCK